MRVEVSLPEVAYSQTEPPVTAVQVVLKARQSLLPEQPGAHSYCESNES